jgi:cell shape-determining protein MreC
MKKFLFIFSVLIFTSCSTVEPARQNTKNQDDLNKVEQKADTTKDALAKIEHDKVVQASIYSTGIQYSLNQVTNAPQPVETASKLNERILSIVGSPDIDEVKKIQQIVDLMNSAVKTEQQKGEKLLNSKDADILALQKENASLKAKYEDQIATILKKSENIAKKGDAVQSTLDKMSGFFGLNAVAWGLKHFFFTALTYILIFGVIFLLLRIFSTINPVVGSIFSIFEVIGSGFISVIKSFLPKSIQFSNLIHLNIHNTYKDTLTKMIDELELLKNNAKVTQKDITVSELIDAWEKSLDQDEKDLLSSISKELKW